MGDSRVLVIGDGALGAVVLDALADAGIAAEPLDEPLDTTTALELFEDYDVVVETSADPEIRYLANDAAVLIGIPLVWGSAAGAEGVAGVAWAERGPHYRDLHPVPPPEDAAASGPDATEPTSLPSPLVNTIGGVLAAEVAKILAESDDVLIGRVLMVDATTGATRELHYERAPFIDRDPLAAQEQARDPDSPFPIVGDPDIVPRPKGITNAGAPRTPTDRAHPAG